VRRLLTLVLAASLAALGAPPPAASAADIHGDDDADRYIGTGGLILPGSMGQSTRQEVAGCAGCQWRLSSPCVASDAGNPFSGTPTCLSVVRGCPQTGEHLRAWFRPQGGAWRDLGMVCIGEGGPTTVTGVTADVREWMERRLPSLRPRLQPSRGIVTQIPVIFDSGQPGSGIDADVMIGGATVHLAATARWSWLFGDGSRLTTTDPGGRYPDSGVRHAYRRSGPHIVDVITTWSAGFTVDGLGPFEVPEPVTQTASATVDVGEGRALLTSQ